MRNRDEDELSNILIDEDDEEQEVEKRGRSKKFFLVVAMAAILLLVIVFAIYALTRSEESDTKSPSEPISAPVPPPTPAAPSQQSPTFSNVGIQTQPTNPSSANDSTGAQRDKFEDIIARIKSEQNKNPESGIPNKPTPTGTNQNTQVAKTPPATNVTPPPGSAPTTSTNNEDIRDLFKAQQQPEQQPSKPTQQAQQQKQPAKQPVTQPTKQAPSQPATPAKTPNVKSSPSGSFFIQAASVSKFSDESDFAKKIKSHNLPYRVQEENVNNKTVYRVLIGPYANKADASKVLETVRFYLEKEAFIKQINE